jgi:3-hydroxyisobutyrate dehydrogenase-like beta-hydroxyacid dehydrogenase
MQRAEDEQFLGLGRAGHGAVAAAWVDRCVDEGFELAVSDRCPLPVAELMAAGAGERCCSAPSSSRCSESGSSCLSTPSGGRSSCGHSSSHTAAAYRAAPSSTTPRPADDVTAERRSRTMARPGAGP